MISAWSWPAHRHSAATAASPTRPPASKFARSSPSIEECGAVTPLRVPAELPPQALRRIVCDGCGASFMPSGIEEMRGRRRGTGARRADPVRGGPGCGGGRPLRSRLAPGHTAAINTSPLADVADRVAIAWAEVVDRVATLPRPELPDWFYDRDSRSWRIVSAIAAAALVIGGLILIQGGGGERPAQPAAESAEAGAAAAKPAKGDGKGIEAGGASFVDESTFSLALPAGWKQSSGDAGATFSASAPGGGADATLWIDRDPSLEFPAFEARSLDQLEALAGSARVVERINGADDRRDGHPACRRRAPGEPQVRGHPARLGALPLLPGDHGAARRAGSRRRRRRSDPRFLPAARGARVRPSRRTVVLAALALCVPIPAWALSGDEPAPETAGTLGVSASLDSCGIAGSSVVCKIDASWNAIDGATSYSASVTSPDGSVVDYGDAGGSGTSFWVPYSGPGTYTVTVSAYGNPPGPDQRELITRDSSGAAREPAGRPGHDLARGHGRRGRRRRRRAGRRRAVDRRGAGRGARSLRGGPRGGAAGRGVERRRG